MFLQMQVLKARAIDPCQFQNLDISKNRLYNGNFLIFSNLIDIANFFFIIILVSTKLKFSHKENRYRCP